MYDLQGFCLEQLINRTLIFFSSEIVVNCSKNNLRLIKWGKLNLNQILHGQSNQIHLLKVVLLSDFMIYKKDETENTETIKNVRKSGRKPTTHGKRFTNDQLKYAFNIMKHLLNKSVITLDELSNSLKSFEKENKHLLETEYKGYETDFTGNKGTLKHHLEKNSFVRATAITNAYYIWVVNYAENLYADIICSLGNDNPNTPEPVNRICDVFSLPHDTVNNNLNKLAGTYCLYRPCHLNPITHVARVKLIIDNVNGASCEFWTEKHDPDPCADDNSISISYNKATGAVAATENSFIMVLKNSQGRPITIVADNLANTTDDYKHFTEISGIIIPFLSSDASSWPFYARRIPKSKETEFKPSTIEYGDGTKIPEQFKKIRSRGFIGW